MQYKVSSEENGLSLLSFLKGKEASLSSKKIKQIIEAGGCTIGDKVEVFSSRKVMEGEAIEVDFEVEKVAKGTISTLFEDKDFLIVDKPPGAICKEGNFPGELIHRLDKDTSGVLMLAKTPYAKKMGIALFAKREVKKLYLAGVVGDVNNPAGVIENFLGKKREYEGGAYYGSMPEGEKAITYWTLLGKGKGYSLLLCDIKTGRTHQIRVHMSEMGHPIVGDYQYGKRSKVAKRQLLHARQLEFTHPRTGKKISITAPIPEDLKKALNELGIVLLKKD